MTQLSQDIGERLRARLDAIGAGRAARNWRNRGSLPRVDSLLAVAEAHLVSIDWLLGRAGAARALTGAAVDGDLGTALRALIASRLIADGREERLVAQLLPAADELLRRLVEDCRRLVDDAVAVSRAELTHDLELALEQGKRRDSAPSELFRALMALRTAGAGPATETMSPFLLGMPPWYVEEVRKRHALEASFDGQAELRRKAAARARRRRSRQTAAATKSRAKGTKKGRRR